MTQRYEITDPPEFTPPFIRWVLAHECELRSGTTLDDAEATDRLLRGLQAYDRARSEGRIIGSIALAQREAVSAASIGFPIAAVFESFGGEEFVSSQCNACPANAVAACQSGSIAGCTGIAIIPETEAFQTASDAFLAANNADDLPTTHPRHRALWIERSPAAARLELIGSFLARFAEDISGAREFAAAIAIAQRTHIPLAIRAFPAGRCIGRNWSVDAHCSLCAAPWPQARRQQCLGCGTVGGRMIERTRKRSGTRPYRKLGEFLSDEEMKRLEGEV